MIRFISAEPSTFSDKITINVPLILKMRDIILSLRANYFMGHFEGAKKVRPPRNIPKWPINEVSQKLKIISKIFKISGTVRPPTGLFYIERDPHSRTETGERDIVLSAQE